MHILPLTLEDCQRASYLHQNAFFKGWGENDFQEFLQNPLIYGLKTEENHELTGYILWREVGEEAEILTLVVSPSYQHRGRASLLLTILFDILMNKYILNLFLEVAEDNEIGKSFYIKHGFVLLGIRPNYYPRAGGKYINALNFFKKLV